MAVKKKKTLKPHSKVGRKKINLALQGGGSLGAFTWGVLDQLLTRDDLEIEGISATSGGAMNAVVMAYGLMTGGREHARELLREFWRKVSSASALLPFKPGLIDKWWGNKDAHFSPSMMMMEYVSQFFSPYQFNLFDYNPLRTILAATVDFEVIRKCENILLFINATNVKTGKIRVFENKEMTIDSVMASACLPHLFKAVMIDGEPYWDGGFSGNPAIYPLIYHTNSLDVVLVQINPLDVEQVPQRPADIMDRINEISFNSTLMREMRAIAFVSDLIESGHLKDSSYKRMRMHMIEAQDILIPLGYNSKINADWDFLQHLNEIGRQATTDWLAKNFDALGKRSSIDIRKVFL